MNLHFNHPDELTPEVKAACGMLADAGIPLGAQTVLLKGVNDDPEIMKQLMHQLLLARGQTLLSVSGRLTKGTNHFRTSVETGLNIIKALQGHTSGMAVPHFVIDAPGGGGKIPLLPADYLVHWMRTARCFRNYENKTFHYPQPEDGTGAGTPHGRRPCCHGIRRQQRLRWGDGRSVKTRSPRGYSSLSAHQAELIAKRSHPRRCDHRRSADPTGQP